MLLNAMKNTLLRRALLMLCITVFAQLGYGQQGADEQPSVLEVIRQGESLVSEGYDLIQQGRIQEGADIVWKAIELYKAQQFSLLLVFQNGHAVAVYGYAHAQFGNIEEALKAWNEALDAHINFLRVARMTMESDSEPFWADETIVERGLPYVIFTLENMVFEYERQKNYEEAWNKLKILADLYETFGTSEEALVVYGRIEKLENELASKQQ